MSGKPFLFIDVDGVLNRIVSNSVSRKRGLTIRHATCNGWRYKIVVDTGDTKRLTSLADVFRLAWGSTWEGEANRQIAPLIGLPTNLPHAHTLVAEDSKAPGVMRLADGAPFVWLDDALTALDRDYLDRYRAPHLIIDVDPAEGLTDDHITQARSWVERLATPENTTPVVDDVG